jgi:hypothetical protein
MSKRMTPKQKAQEAVRVAAYAVGRRTHPNGALIERARVVDDWVIVVTFAGSGLAPFREARYTAKEVMGMITLPNGMVTPQDWK